MTRSLGSTAYASVATAILAAGLLITLPASDITSNGSGTLTVNAGTHTYAAAGTFTVTVKLSDDAPGTSTASISNGTSPSVVTAKTASLGAVTPVNVFDLALSQVNVKKNQGSV